MQINQINKNIPQTFGILPSQKTQEAAETSSKQEGLPGLFYCHSHDTRETGGDHNGSKHRQ